MPEDSPGNLLPAREQEEERISDEMAAAVQALIGRYESARINPASIRGKENNRPLWVTNRYMTVGRLGSKSS